MAFFEPNILDSNAVIIALHTAIIWHFEKCKIKNLMTDEFCPAPKLVLNKCKSELYNDNGEQICKLVYEDESSKQVQGTRCDAEICANPEYYFYDKFSKGVIFIKFSLKPGDKLTINNITVRENWFNPDLTDPMKERFYLGASCCYHRKGFGRIIAEALVKIAQENGCETMELLEGKCSRVFWPSVYGKPIVEISDYSKDEDHDPQTYKQFKVEDVVKNIINKIC